MSTVPAAPPVKYVLGYRSRTRSLTLNPNPNPKINQKQNDTGIKLKTSNRDCSSHRPTTNRHAKNHFILSNNQTECLTEQNKLGLGLTRLKQYSQETTG